MKVRDHMSSRVVSVGPSTNIAEIAAILNKHGIYGVPVVDAEGRLLGTVSHDELMGVFVPHYLSMLDELAFVGDLGAIEARTMSSIEPSLFVAEDVMRAHPITVTPETSLMKVAALLSNKKLGFVPVVDDRNRVVGVVSRSDVTNAFTGVPRGEGR